MSQMIKNDSKQVEILQFISEDSFCICYAILLELVKH